MRRSHPCHGPCSHAPFVQLLPHVQGKDAMRAEAVCRDWRNLILSNQGQVYSEIYVREFGPLKLPQRPAPLPDSHAHAPPQAQGHHQPVGGGAMPAGNIRWKETYL